MQNLPGLTGQALNEVLGRKISWLRGREMAGTLVEGWVHVVTIFESGFIIVDGFWVLIKRIHGDCLCKKLWGDAGDTHGLTSKVMADKEAKAWVQERLVF